MYRDLFVFWGYGGRRKAVRWAKIVLTETRQRWGFSLGLDNCVCAKIGVGASSPGGWKKSRVDFYLCETSWPETADNLSHLRVKKSCGPPRTGENTAHHV